MPPPRSTTTCSSTTPRWRACCRAVGCSFPARSHSPGAPDGASRCRLSPPLVAAAPAGATPPFAADYVQAPGSTLIFAGTYEGEAFTGRFPAFVTRFSFDPASSRPPSSTSPFRSPARPPATATTTASCAAPRSSTREVPAGALHRNPFPRLGGNQFAADGTLSLRGVSKPVTLTFTWTPGAKPVLAGKATVKRPRLRHR